MKFLPGTLVFTCPLKHNTKVYSIGINLEDMSTFSNGLCFNENISVLILGQFYTSQFLICLIESRICICSDVNLKGYNEST